MDVRTVTCGSPAPSQANPLLRLQVTMIPRIRTFGTFFLFLSTKNLLPLVLATDNVDLCPGYNAINVQVTDTTLKAELILAGEPCRLYGEDIAKLSLEVEYQTESRIHVKIKNSENARYEIPEEVFPRPSPNNPVAPSIKFRYSPSPFSFSIHRVDTEETLFDTNGYSLVFAPQYLRLKTSLPRNANIYGLGEHTESFRLPTQNLTRTLWARDSIRIPTGTNLYGAHPVYFEHRTSGTHGVFLLNSNGMDVKIKDENEKTSLEYNIIGGILDLYFFAGPTPKDVARQYAQVVGYPAEVPYWSFGLHQCRFGYKDINEVQQVVANYSAAGIPLETMWIDIDYMDDRLVFTTDPALYPKNELRQFISDLHSKDQRFVMMVDPAIGTRPGQTGAYDRGSAMDVWLKGPDGKPHIGIVWPGTVVFPDWFHPSTNTFWNGEFNRFFNPQTGFDIDGVWIDMNEPASFCYHPCTVTPDSVNITEVMLTLGNVPPLETASINTGRDGKTVDLFNPPYAIANDLPRLSDRTAPVDAVHHNGILEYDAHNLYGSMMSIATQKAMYQRKHNLRTFVITRSTFAGIGSKVGKWLGDNVSDWVQYRFSIAGMLSFASIYQVPMVGSDVCGFVDNTTETLCARWAMLGAFSPFYRNHNDIASIPQEFYRWPVVANAARAALDIRYKLLDYLYTAFHTAHLDGTPVIQPLFFAYPNDQNTYKLEHQFLFGDSIMVAPVLEEGSKDVEIYLPNDFYYDFRTGRTLESSGETAWVRQVEFDEIPLLIRGGSILPMRMESALTTTDLRTKDFELAVAPGLDGTAKGQLYVDDGVSLVQASTLQTFYAFDGELLYVSTTGEYDAGVKYQKISILGVDENPTAVYLLTPAGHAIPSGVEGIEWDSKNEVLRVYVSMPLKSSFGLQLVWSPSSSEEEISKESSSQATLHDEL